MKQVPVILLGAGGVGAELLRQIVHGRDQLAARNQCAFSVVGVADSRSCLWDADGLSDEALLAAVDRKANGQPVNDSGETRPSNLDLLAKAEAAGLKKGVLVDVTAEDGMEPMLDKALALGWGLALANKKAFAGPLATAQAYFNHPFVRHESTVGGGQPVIATLRYLLDTNDPIYAIEGQLSGTFGFICDQLDNGALFSSAVAEAKQLGYTEPDPREDLGGQDVMRKVMILGRMAGWPLEASDIEVESLYPAEMDDLSVAAFLSALPQLDEAMAARSAEAQANGQVLRFVAEVSPKGGTVGLKAVDKHSPLAGLKYISFDTSRYHDENLLICGKGAGVEMTAAGVLGDMVDLVREVL